jgi:hypothetical protein
MEKGNANRLFSTLEVGQRCRHHPYIPDSSQITGCGNVTELRRAEKWAKNGQLNYGGREGNAKRSSGGVSLDFCFIRIRIKIFL